MGIKWLTSCAHYITVFSDYSVSERTQMRAARMQKRINEAYDVVMLVDAATPADAVVQAVAAHERATGRQIAYDVRAVARQASGARDRAMYLVSLSVRYYVTCVAIPMPWRTTHSIT